METVAELKNLTFIFESNVAPEKIKNLEMCIEEIVSRRSASEINECISILKSLCLTSLDHEPLNRVFCLMLLYKVSTEEGQDMLARWRDMLSFFSGDKKAKAVETLTIIANSPRFNSYERLYTATTLYNHFYLEYCYDCFKTIAFDEEVIVDHRMEAIRYLFASEEHRESAQNILLDIIESQSIDSSIRYRFIAGFITTTGIATVLNQSKIKIPYDEEFVYGLQKVFFFNDDNSPRERILSGQHLLQMDIVSESEKNEVLDILLDFAKNDELIDNVRADAADVCMRLGYDERRMEARKVIKEIGYDAIQNKKGVGTIAELSKTIYNDSQNIHLFTKQIDIFIEKMIKETDIQLKTYNDVHTEVVQVIKRYVKDNTEKFKALRALNRISVDTAHFTSHRVTLAEIFVHVWLRICLHPEEIREELCKRLVEELVDMSETCSSGHSGRFINILSSYDIDLKITWDEQIQSNIVGRLNARIRDHPHEDVKEQLLTATTAFAEDEDKRMYNAFLHICIPDIRNEMKGEFVGEGYMTEDEFDEAFEKAVLYHGF
jgi:hypothetical protein